MPDSNILFVDDDGDSLQNTIRALRALQVPAALHCAGNERKARELARELRPQVAVIDLSLVPARGVESGFELLRELVRLDGTCRIIVLTGHGIIEYGIRALSLGAASFLQKPADLPHLAALIRDGITQSELKRSYLKLKDAAHNGGHDLLTGSSTAIVTVKDAVRDAARTPQSILITGETGTGKGVCAAAIHALSSRREKPFIRYQPTFATPDLVNSELFGHVKGAFTGAACDRAGLLKEADGGTLFLDEVDELPAETQIALLGVLQDRIFRPVGSSREVTADFRLICATNGDIAQSVARGKIRGDFFHRIAHARIEMPPLRHRREDLSALSLDILEALRRQERVSVLDITEEAIAWLTEYQWPGNIRELEAVVEGAAYRTQLEGRLHIEARDIKFPSNHSSAEEPGFHARVERFKEQTVREALAQNGGNQARAARELGLDRSSLRRILGLR